MKLIGNAIDSDYWERRRRTTARVASGNYPVQRRRPSREDGARHQPVTPRTPRSRTGELNSLKDQTWKFWFFGVNKHDDLTRWMLPLGDARRSCGEARDPKRKTRAAIELRVLTCVACVYYPLVCRWSSEAGGESRGCRPEGYPGRYTGACATPYHLAYPLASLRWCSWDSRTFSRDSPRAGQRAHGERNERRAVKNKSNPRASNPACWYLCEIVRCTSNAVCLLADWRWNLLALVYSSIL